MVEGTALEKRQVGGPGARVQIPPSPLSFFSPPQSGEGFLVSHVRFIKNSYSLLTFHYDFRNSIDLGAALNCTVEPFQGAND